MTRSAGRNHCPVCNQNEPAPVFERRGVPTQDGVLWRTRDEALNSPIGDIELAICRRCGAIANIAHDPNLVEFSDYNVSTDHSDAFREFVSSLATRIVDTYQLRGKNLLDIACGTGAFLRELCRQGGNRGTN
jgi:hypothetical protein